MHSTYRLLAAVKSAMQSEGLTMAECDRVLMTVVTQEINAKVERFQFNLLRERDNFLNPPDTDDAYVGVAHQRLRENGV